METTAAFDGIDVVMLPATDTDRLVELYAGVMGFAVDHDEHDPDPAWQQLLALGHPAERVRLLTKPGATGGAIALVETPGLEDVGPPGAPGRRGPYALDFYVRDSDEIEARLAHAGWTFTSEPVDYLLPGTEIPVRERMLVQEVSGLLHAIVQHRPRGTRSVLGDDPAQDCSEVVAVVCLAPQIDDARQFAIDALGGHEYFHGAFEGPEIERMLHMGPGERLDGSLFRGPGSRNARLEFAWRPGACAEPPVATPRVALGLRVDDVAIADRWAGQHGSAGPATPLPWAGERLRARRFASRHDTTFLLLSTTA